jgi:hypothetical protein
LPIVVLEDGHDDRFLVGCARDGEAVGEIVSAPINGLIGAYLIACAAAWRAHRDEHSSGAW